MSDIFQQDISDPNFSPNMQQEPATYTHIHNKEANEATDPDPTSPSLKVKDESVGEVSPSSAMEEVTRKDPAPSTLKRKQERNEATRTYLVPPPLKRKEETDEATRTDPAPSPLPNVEPVSKGTDGNPTLDTSSPLGEYEEIQSQLDEMEGEADSSDILQTPNKDAELHLKSMDLYTSEQLSSSWIQTQKVDYIRGYE
ncbi:hypothetical protein P9112_000338 [Eukaryota sp. TZLM1-RC]